MATANNPLFNPLLAYSSATLYGMQWRRYPPTHFDACLKTEAELWRWIQARGGVQAVCPGRKYTEPPWVRMPQQGKRYSKIASIALPPNDGLDHLVGSRLVPVGFDSCIVSIITQAAGTIGFAEGSGDLTWRFQINERYAKDYGNIQVQIGSTTTPYNINSGQILAQSGNLIQMFVNRSVLSGGTIAGGRIIMGMFGWDWPR